MRACRVTVSNISRRALLSLAAPSFTSGQRFASAASSSTEAETKPETESNKPAEGGETSELESKVEALEKQLEERTKEAKEMKAQAQYAAADAENARRIAKIDVDKAKDFSVTAIAKDMLEVADTLNRAIEAFNKLDKETTEKANHVLTGVKMSQNVLAHNLGRHGIEKMKLEKGTEFDPNLHEALFKAPASDEVKGGHVTMVVKEGYTIKERVLRAAQVGVAEQE